MSQRHWIIHFSIALSIFFSGSESAMGSEDSIWSRFRGPNGSGVSDASHLPVRFGPSENVVWRTELPPGHSSPVLSEDRVFLTAFEGEALLTYALDPSSGAIRWSGPAPRARAERVD